MSNFILVVYLFMFLLGKVLKFFFERTILTLSAKKITKIHSKNKKSPPPKLTNIPKIHPKLTKIPLNFALDEIF
jgi:hypothetical protein